VNCDFKYSECGEISARIEQIEDFKHLNRVSTVRNGSQAWVAVEKSNLLPSEAFSKPLSRVNIHYWHFPSQCFDEQNQLITICSTSPDSGETRKYNIVKYEEDQERKKATGNGDIGVSIKCTKKGDMHFSAPCVTPSAMLEQINYYERTKLQIG